jgi:hypothetical protein
MGGSSHRRRLLPHDALHLRGARNDGGGSVPERVGESRGGPSPRCRWRARITAHRTSSHPPPGQLQIGASVLHRGTGDGAPNGRSVRQAEPTSMGVAATLDEIGSKGREVRDHRFWSTPSRHRPCRIAGPMRLAPTLHENAESVSDCLFGMVVMGRQPVSCRRGCGLVVLTARRSLLDALKLARVAGGECSAVAARLFR